MYHKGHGNKRVGHLIGGTEKNSGKCEDSQLRVLELNTGHFGIRSRSGDVTAATSVSCGATGTVSNSLQTDVNKVASPRLVNTEIICSRTIPSSGRTVD